MCRQVEVWTTERAEEDASVKHEVEHRKASIVSLEVRHNAKSLALKVSGWQSRAAFGGRGAGAGKCFGKEQLGSERLFTTRADQRTLMLCLLAADVRRPARCVTRGEDTVCEGRGGDTGVDLVSGARRCRETKFTKQGWMGLQMYSVG